MDERHPWFTPEMKDLVDAFFALRNRVEMQNFLRDLCTLSELDAMAHRWAVAQLLDQGLPYTEVAKRTGASTTTVTRVAQWLRHGEGGYESALHRVKKLAKSG